MNNPKYSIIIPTKNEEEAIAKTICSIPKNVKERAEIIVVDSSDDFTPVIAKKLEAKVIFCRKKGKGNAMKYAVEKSKGEVLVFLDGDGTDPPEYIPKILEKIKTHDMVLGARSSKTFREDDSAMRNIYNIYSIPIRLLFKLINFRIKGDPLAGFRAIRRKDWDRMGIKSGDFRIETEMNIKAIKMGFRIGEVTIPNLRRGGGILNSKTGSPKVWISIVDTVLDYVTNEKIKNKIEELRERYAAGNFA